MEWLNKRRILYFSGGIFACCLFLLFYVFYNIFKSSDYPEDRNIIIEVNSSDEDIAHALIEGKVTDSPFIAKIAVSTAKKIGLKLEAGEYWIPKGASVYRVLKIFSTDRKVVRKITIPEGFSVAQFIDRLNENEFLTGRIDEIPAEGSLMPDTYCFCYPASRQHIIDQARKMMSDFIKKEWPKRSRSCFLKTPEEAIILASIVEKETFLERELVAGVYLNRLQKKMRLQACPTVIYGITKGKPLMRKLLYSDLKKDSPYNTYRNSGLPPTAITNPGRESILAVLHPKETEYLFFVFDGNNRHIFSKTFEEHKQNRKNINQSLRNK